MFETLKALRLPFKSGISQRFTLTLKIQSHSEWSIQIEFLRPLTEMYKLNELTITTIPTRIHVLSFRPALRKILFPVERQD